LDKRHKWKISYDCIKAFAFKKELEKACALKKEEKFVLQRKNVLEYILHMEKTHFLQPCASSNKSKSTWVVFGRTSTVVCSCIFQVSFTTSASINTTS